MEMQQGAESRQGAEKRQVYRILTFHARVLAALAACQLLLEELKAKDFVELNFP
jgi:hypothetical protein